MRGAQVEELAFPLIEVFVVLECPFSGEREPHPPQQCMAVPP
jgi:hypothetical protein